MKYLVFILMFLSSKIYASNWWETEKPDFLSESSILNVHIERDINYGFHNRQKLDIYTPAQTNGKIIFLIHGGAWMSGDKRSSQLVVAKVNHFSQLGYIVVSVNYRFIPEVSIYEQLEDMKNAYQFVINNKGSRIIMMGHSSGAYMSLLLASRVSPLAIVSLDSPGYDMQEIMAQKHASFFDYVFTDKNKLKELSPINYIGNHKYLIVCSKSSPLWCRQAKNFAVKSGADFIETNLNHQQVNSLLGLDKSYTKKVDNFLQTLE